MLCKITTTQVEENSVFSSQRTSERVQAAIKSRYHKGLFKGSVAPYGYKVDIKLNKMVFV